MSFARMGLRFLNKRRMRTILTMLAIVLGVGILTGINVTSDSIEVAINTQIYDKLGNNDIIVRGNRSVDGGWFDYSEANTAVSGVSGVKSTVPRIIKSHTSYPISNQTSGWNSPFVAINTNDPAEKSFGRCNILKALDSSFINTSRIEDLFQQYSSLVLPVVVSQDYANNFQLAPGDPFYIFPEDTTPFGSEMVAQNTSTWLEGTIIGIIKDESESVTDFMPPARIWELYPPSIAVYLDLQDAWDYAFNLHVDQVNMLFVQAHSPAEIKETMANIQTLESQNIFPGGVFTENVKSLFTEGILQVNSLMRGIFSIFSAISLLVCALIIKNLLEMSKEEQTQEIGIMRAIGVTKSKVFILYIVQILFISIIGSAAGLGLGYLLSSFFLGSYIDAANAVGTDFSSYAITPVMSGMTALIGMAAGVLISLVFGFFPARAAANLDPLEALRSKSEQIKGSLLVRTIQKAGGLTVSIVILVAGIIIIGSAFGGLFILDVVNPNIIILLFVGVMLLILGIVFVAGFLFPIVVSGLSYFLLPFLKKLRGLTSRNLTRYSRQTKNTFSMLAIGLCMMITVGTIMNSAYAGAYPGGRTITGGDIAIGNIFQGHVPKDPHTQGLRDLPSVKEAVPIRFAIGFEGLTRIDRLLDNSTFGGYADSTFETIRESFHLGIIDSKEYAKLHSHDSILKLSNKSHSLNFLMDELETPYTVVLQDRLARRLGNIKEGEKVQLRFEGFEAIFTVVGIVEVLPGFYWSYYTADSTYDKQFVGAISWNSYDKLISDNFGSADLVARNKFLPPEEYQDILPEEKYWGYISTPIDYKTLESLMEQTGSVERSARRITSPLWGVPPFKWQDSDNDKVLWQKDGAVSSDWNTLISRAVIIDPSADKPFGKTGITATHSQIPKNYRENLETIFEWCTTNMPGINFCALNEMYVNMNLTSGEWDYIRQFAPGESIRLYYNDSLYTDFLVVATTNSNYPYEFIDSEGNHFGDTGVLNQEFLSYNPFLLNSTDWDFYFEVIDLEPNSIFIPNNDIVLPPEITDDYLPSLFNQSSTYSSESEEDSYTFDPALLSLVNQTLASMFLLNTSSFDGDVVNSQWVGNYTFDGTTYTFNGSTITVQGVEQNISFNVNFTDGSQLLNDIISGNANLVLENLTSSVIFDLDDDMTADDIRNLIFTMNEVCKTIPTLQNVTFFAPKLFIYEESGLFDVYFLIGTENKGTIGAALAEIENYYKMHNLPWDPKWNQLATEMEDQVGGILGLIINLFFGVLSFALITSLLGLSISTIISIRKRYAEIGTLRTLGFSNKQILTMVTSEGVITAVYGMMVGVIAGLLIAGLIIANLPFMIFLPILFTPPYELIAQGILLLILAATAVSFLPAISAVKIDIAEAIRTKGE